MALVLLLSACTQTPVKNEQSKPVESVNTPVKTQAIEEQYAASYADLESFRLSDKTNTIVDKELLAIPSDYNPMVEKWVAYFQGSGRRHMEKYLARMTRYEKLMKRVLTENGLPEDLFYIALIESGFNGVARSHAQAVGYWQFIRGTGKRYGLRMNAFMDERRDPVLATQAAAEYFKGLYGMFNSWYLSMAAYNVGEGRVKREIMKHNTNDFWEIARLRALPMETVNYVPKYIAARMIATNPEKYGFDEIDYLPAIEFDHIMVDFPVNIRKLAEGMNVNYEDFKALNPKYKGEVAPVYEGKLVIRIPAGMQQIASEQVVNCKSDGNQFVADGDTRDYKIRSGETISSIARKFRTTVAYLRDLNDLPRRKKLRVGMRIQVPNRNPQVIERKKMQAKKTSQPNADFDISNTKFHIVQNGDSLTSIAKRYSVKVSDIRKVNNLKSGGKLKIGIKLVIPDNESERKNVNSGKRKETQKVKVSLQEQEKQQIK